MESPTVWRYWAENLAHELGGDISSCSGWFTILLKDTDLTAEQKSKVLETCHRHLARLSAYGRFFRSIARSSTIEDIVRAMQVVGPGLEVMVTDDARKVPIPSDELIPALWMIVGSQMAVIRVDIDDRNYCRVIVGPDTEERNDEWKDVTEEACKDHWMGAAATAFRAAGIEIHVRSNGPLAEVTIRWAHAV